MRDGGREREEESEREREREREREGKGEREKESEREGGRERDSFLTYNYHQTHVQHLNIFQAHKRNVFEINLPNKVTKIMAVPPRGTVKDAIKPVLKKHGYSFDIMELRFANNFKVSAANPMY